MPRREDVPPLVRRTRVYLTGPLTAGGKLTDRDAIHANLQKAIEAGEALLKAGYAPLVPHLTQHWHERYPNPHRVWLEMDVAWLIWADCLLLLPGWQDSAGARQEREVAAQWEIPCYESLEDLLSCEPPHRRVDVERVLREMQQLHHAKSQGYGSDEDPLHNVEAAREWGIPSWVGALIRGSDKMRRLQSFTRRGEWAFESARDNLVDLAVYAAIAVALFDRDAQGR